MQRALLAEARCVVFFADDEFEQLELRVGGFALFVVRFFFKQVQLHGA